MRVDVLLHRLRLTRSRSEAKSACDVGAVLVDGIPAKPAQPVRAGQRVEVRYPALTLVVELGELPPKSLSKKAARDYYTVLSERPADLHP